MNRILAVFCFVIFTYSVTTIAEEKTKPEPMSTTPSQSSAVNSSKGDKKASENPPKEEANIIDFCRTHTC